MGLKGGGADPKQTFAFEGDFAPVFAVIVTFRPEARNRLHLLFVVSRPSGSAFLDARADARSALDSIVAFQPSFLPNVVVVFPSSCGTIGMMIRRVYGE